MNDLLLRALRNEPLPRPPVWLMRQAGRTDPQYLALRARCGLTLEALFAHPAYAAEVTLQPKRIGVDALILFQDILTPLGPMGAPFVFAPGPVTAHPVRTPEDAARLQPFAIDQGLGFVGETLERVHATLAGEVPVLGFAGAPFTLLTFLCEGGSFGDDIGATRAFLAQYPEAAHALLARIAAVTIDYLRYQAAHGVVAVQLFESAAHLATPAEYDAFALPYQQQVFAALRGVVPTIHFARELPDLARLAAAGAEILSLPADLSIAEVRAALGPDARVQGNFDNHFLVHATPEQIRARAQEIIEDGGCRGHIFNLSHGLLRETPHANVLALVAAVREYERGGK